MPALDIEHVVATHLDAAFNVAVWMLRDRQSAEDVVQEAMLRAVMYFRSYRGGNSRAWVLQIVRNTALEHLRSTKDRPTVSFDNLAPSQATSEEGFASTLLAEPADTPDVAFMKARSREEVAKAVNQLPLELRECIVLREFEELSYKEIAQITGSPIGTIMSRLWRARKLLLQTFLAEGYS
jgi:RNA polymerase sigma-70 factor (ECF subfamily)